MGHTYENWGTYIRLTDYEKKIIDLEECIEDAERELREVKRATRGNETIESGEISGRINRYNVERDITMVKYRIAVYNAMIAPVMEVLGRYKGQLIGKPQRAEIADELTRLAPSSRIVCYVFGQDYNNVLPVNFALISGRDVVINYNLETGEIVSLCPRDFTADAEQMREKRKQIDALYQQMETLIDAYNDECWALDEYRISGNGLKSQKRF